ncbi:MAG: Imm39 family immunity protein [Candidatus Sedimenticola sp. (ex Thyasira tokunagai)]
MTTVAKPPHNRKLGLLEVSLTKQRLKPKWGTALDWVRDDIEKIIIDSGFLAEASFSWVTIAIRYGLNDDEQPGYQSINKKFGDLPLSIEVDTNRLIDASIDELKVIFGRTVLMALIHAGHKFERPVNALKERLASLKINGEINGVRLD